MIPQKIQALFTFIDYLNNNKKEYIEKYIPLCNSLSELDKKRKVLNPSENYRSKQLYDEVQKEIEEKFPPLIDYVYAPITNQLKELEIWTGDEMFLSIWNDNIGDIYNFKREFESEDVALVMEYKQKYKSFREDTNSNFLCLSFVFNALDETLKELFDFFKDTKENEFKKFESKVIQVKNLEDAIKSFAESRDSNISFSIPIETILPKRQQNSVPNHKTKIKQKFVMGNEIKTGDIKNSGQINVGTGNSNHTIKDDKLSKKSFNWLRLGTIATIILGIITAINWEKLIAYFS